MNMIDRNNKKLSISRQAKFLGINRASLYYKPVPISDDEYLIKRIIDEVYTAHPEYGYRRMKRGFMYLVAIIDWYSRYIVGFAISNTLERTFIIDAIKKAIKRHGAPEIMNSDQGSQFTCDDYISVLKENNIKISRMEKVGHWTINA